MSLVDAVGRALARLVARGTSSDGGGTSDKPSQTLLGALGGGQTATGLAIGPTRAMQATAVWACVQAISQDEAKIPPTLKRRRKDGGSDVVTDHPLVKVIRRPNGWQSWFEFAQFRSVSKLLYGNAYAYKSYDRAGRLTQMIPIRPDRVIVLEAPDGSLFYQISPGTTFERAQLEAAGLDNVTAPAWAIHHVRGMSLDGVVGLSPVAMLRESIALSLAMEKHGAKLFGNGARLMGVLRHPERISAEAAARIAAAWREAYSGLDNAFKTALLEEGMEYQSMSMSNEDAQFLEARQFQIGDIARIYRVPPHKIGDLARSTNNNIEHQSLEYYTDTLMPHFEAAEARMDLDLLTEDERAQGLYFEHDVARLLRGDMKSRYEAYAIGRQWGWLSVNDIRGREGLNPVDGGDQYLVPLNMVPAGTEMAAAERALLTRMLAGRDGNPSSV